MLNSLHKIHLLETAKSFAEKDATLSTCSKLQVGCSFISADYSTVFSEHNRPHGGLLPGFNCKENGCTLINGKCMNNIHAEQALIIASAEFNIQTQGGIVVVTHTPCANCTILLIESKISALYIKDQYKENPLLFQWFKNANISIFDWAFKQISW